MYEVALVAAGIAVMLLILAIYFLSEPLVSYRGMPSDRHSFSYKDWEDPVYSNFHATRLIGGGLPDECRDDVIGPDVARITGEDTAFLQSRGIKLQTPRTSKLRGEAFDCGQLATDAAASFSIAKGPPAIYTHGSQILQVNKALEQKIWDPVVTGPHYSYKI